MRAAAVEPLAHDFAARVSAYSGLALPAELPPLEVVDRPAWIAANLQTMRPMLAPLTRPLGDGDGRPVGAAALRLRGCCSAPRSAR